MPVCQICHKREASLFFTRIVNGKKNELQVCRQCAAENSVVKMDLNNLLAGLAAYGLNNANPEEAQTETLTCSECGMTLDEFNSTGLMGCSHCYETFSEPIETLLGRVHGNVRHTGKRAGTKTGLVETPERELERLKAELANAVMEEAYERAAEIRDHIRAIEKGVS